MSCLIENKNVTSSLILFSSNLNSVILIHWKVMRIMWLTLKKKANCVTMQNLEDRQLIYVGHLESKERLRIQPVQLFHFS